jgi:hypothetical protein
MKNDREVYFIGEKTGYAQLYAVPFDTACRSWARNSPTSETTPGSTRDQPIGFLPLAVAHQQGGYSDLRDQR